MIAGTDKSLPKWGNFQVLHFRVGSYPYLEALDIGGKACQSRNSLALYKHL